jgi:predicted DNA-binding transcriptional regulator AlpA
MKKIHEILSLLRDISNLLQAFVSNRENADEQVWTIEEASIFLKLSKPDIYAKISEKTTPDPSKRIPHYRKGHKTIYFLKSELISWIKKG